MSAHFDDDMPTLIVRTTVAALSADAAADRHVALARELLEAAEHLQRSGAPGRVTALAIAAGVDGAKAFVIQQTGRANEVLNDQDLLEALGGAGPRGQACALALQALLDLRGEPESPDATAGHDAAHAIELAQDLIKVAGESAPGT
jgi:hypothetical protein